MRYPTRNRPAAWMPAVRHNRSQNAGLVYMLREVAAGEALMKVSSRIQVNWYASAVRSYRPSCPCGYGDCTPSAEKKTIGLWYLSQALCEKRRSCFAFETQLALSDSWASDHLFRSEDAT